MKTWKIFFVISLISLTLSVTGCKDAVEELAGVEPANVKNIKITMIAKSSANPVFLSAKVGAEAAAKSISEKYRKINVTIDWRTPAQENPQEQAEKMRSAVDDGASAILVSCSDKDTLTAAINAAVEKGIPVMTFDSDAQDSKRFAFYGPNDLEIGQNVMAELVKLMGEKGQIAILAGNAAAPNLQTRVEGVQKEAAKYAGIEIVGVFNHIETAEDAAAEVIRVNNAYPELKGWAMVGGWPFFSDALMGKIDPQKIKIVAVDALPVQLPYIEKGIVPVMLGQPTFKWGKVSVETIVDKIHFNKEVPVTTQMKLIKVSKDNLGGWSRQLRAWGYTGIPEEYLKM